MLYLLNAEEKLHSFHTQFAVLLEFLLSPTSRKVFGVRKADYDISKGKKIKLLHLSENLFPWTFQSDLPDHRCLKPSQTPLTLLIANRISLFLTCTVAVFPFVFGFSAIYSANLDSMSGDNSKPQKSCLSPLGKPFIPVVTSSIILLASPSYAACPQPCSLSDLLSLKTNAHLLCKLSQEPTLTLGLYFLLLLLLPCPLSHTTHQSC